MSRFSTLTHEFQCAKYYTNKELVFLSNGKALKARWFLKSDHEMFVSIHACKKEGYILTIHNFHKFEQGVLYRFTDKKYHDLISTFRYLFSCTVNSFETLLNFRMKTQETQETQETPSQRRILDEVQKYSNLEKRLQACPPLELPTLEEKPLCDVLKEGFTEFEWITLKHLPTEICDYVKEPFSFDDMEYFENEGFYGLEIFGKIYSFDQIKEKVFLPLSVEVEVKYDDMPSHTILIKDCKDFGEYQDLISSYIPRWKTWYGDEVKEYQYEKIKNKLIQVTPSRSLNSKELHALLYNLDVDYNDKQSF